MERSNNLISKAKIECSSSVEDQHSFGFQKPSRMDMMSSFLDFELSLCALHSAHYKVQQSLAPILRFFPNSRLFFLGYQVHLKRRANVKWSISGCPPNLYYNHTNVGAYVMTLTWVCDQSKNMEKVCPRMQPRSHIHTPDIHTPRSVREC